MSASAAPLPAAPPAAAAAGDARSDEVLFAAYQRGEVAAFRLLVERHHRPVFRFCLRALGNPEAAEDAAQEVFLRVVRNAAAWQPQAKFTTWLYTIARNFCIDEARKRVHRRTESLNAPRGDEASGEERIDAVPAATPGSDQLTDAGRMRVVIDRAVAALPEEQREVFCLREHGDLSFREMADVLGVGENTLKSRMRYALVALRRALEAAGFQAPDSS